jgi:hypothetical protein
MNQRDAKKAQNGADIHSNLLSVEEILWGSSHALTIFNPKAIQALEIFAKQSKPYLNCYATGKDRPAKPEKSSGSSMSKS